MWTATEPQRHCPSAVSPSHLNIVTGRDHKREYRDDVSDSEAALLLLRVGCLRRFPFPGTWRKIRRVEQRWKR